MKTNTNKKSTFENIDYLLLFFFILSLLNHSIGTLYCLVLFLYLKKGTVGKVKALVLITFRGVISPAIGAGIGNGIVKWFLILGMSLLILNTVHAQEHIWKISRISAAVMLFCISVVFTSFLNSSYPVTAIFKSISFALPFCAIIKGIRLSSKYYDWSSYIWVIMTIFMCSSFVLIPFMQFRIVNTDFQGVFNHVNTMGTMCVIYLAITLCSSIGKKYIHFRNIMILITLVMVYLSASRTGMVSCLLVLICYFLFRGNFNVKKIIFICFLIGLTIYLIMAIQGVLDDPLAEVIHSIMWKNSQESIFDSRLEIIENARKRFLQHPLLGTGFMVPFEEGIRNYNLDFSLMVEPGNLFYMLLGDTGIIGLIIFIILFISILKRGKIQNLYLIVAAIAINFGEMAFFSSNNYSILLYYLIAYYISGESSVEN